MEPNADIQEQKGKAEKEIRKLESMGGSFRVRAESFRDSAFQRFPVVFVLLSSFGLVATFYGFEKVIDEIQFFSDNPRMILVVGIFTLVATGSLYKKLS